MISLKIVKPKKATYNQNLIENNKHLNNIKKQTTQNSIKLQKNIILTNSYFKDLCLYEATKNK